MLLISRHPIYKLYYNTKYNYSQLITPLNVARAAADVLGAKLGVLIRLLGVGKATAKEVCHEKVEQ